MSAISSYIQTQFCPTPKPKIYLKAIWIFMYVAKRAVYTSIYIFIVYNTKCSVLFKFGVLESVKLKLWDYKSCHRAVKHFSCTYGKKSWWFKLSTYSLFIDRSKCLDELVSDSMAWGSFFILNEALSRCKRWGKGIFFSLFRVLLCAQVHLVLTLPAVHS